MALSDANLVDVRRWLGFATLNGNEPDWVFSNVSTYGQVSLTNKLLNITAAEEATLIAQYLTPLASLEAALLAASDNLDTDSAGPFKQDALEVPKRTALYNKWRRDMAGFLGFPPGPALGAGGMQVVRC